MLQSFNNEPTIDRSNLMALFAEWNPAPVIRLDSELNIVMSNQAAKDAFCQGNCNRHLFLLVPVLKDNSDFLEWINKDDPNTCFYCDLKQKDNRTFQFTFKKLPDGFIHAYGSDITARIRAEKLREDVERIVKHDMKTPLNGIIGFAQLLSDSSTADKEKEYISFILNSGYNLLHMINHSLDLFKMEEGTYQLNSFEFDFIKLIRRLDKEFETTKRSKSIDIIYLLNEKPINSNTIFSLIGEELHLSSLFANLIKNALEASPENEKVCFSINENTDYLISIHNKGVIPPEIQNRFFDRYVTGGKKGGTGIGTYSAKLIAKTHGGDISFISNEDQGTTLNVTLPKSC